MAQADVNVDVNLDEDAIAATAEGFPARKHLGVLDLEIRIVVSVDRGLLRRRLTLGAGPRFAA